MQNSIKKTDASNFISYQGLLQGLLVQTEYLIMEIQNKIENLQPPY